MLLNEIKDFFDELKNELEFERYNSLTNLLHVEVLNYYLDTQDFITDERRTDIFNIMTALVKPYTDNNDLINHISPIIDQLHSNELRISLREVLRRHFLNGFCDHYNSVLSYQKNHDEKPSYRFEKGFRLKRRGASFGSMGFKVIIPSQSGKFSKYLNLCMIKQGILHFSLSSPKREASNAKIIRAKQGGSLCKERLVTNPIDKAYSPTVAVKIIPHFMTFKDLFDKRDILLAKDRYSDPIDYSGLIFGKPVIGLDKVLQLMISNNCHDPHLENFGIIDMGEYFQAEVIDFDYYDPPEVDNGSYDTDPLAKIICDSSLLPLLKIIWLSSKSLDEGRFVALNIFPADYFSNLERLNNSLISLNPWLWKHMLRAYDENPNNDPKIKECVAQSTMKFILYHMNDIPDQQTYAIKYFIKHPLAQEKYTSDKTCFDVLSGIFKCESPETRDTYVCKVRI